MQKQADQQAAFAAALIDPALPAPPGVRRQAKLPQSRRFDLYRNNMMASLIEAMEATFPAVRRLVGSDFFKAAAKTYIRREPPRSPVLLTYGETFGSFLDDFAPAKGVPYLGDVARLEWARLDAYHAADVEPLPIARLAAVHESELESTKLRLHPSLRLLRSRFPLASLWAASNGTAPSAEVNMQCGEAVAVLRPALAVDVRLLPPGGYEFISQLAAGETLGEAADRAVQSNVGFDLATHLQGLFELGAVVAIDTPRRELQKA